MPEKTISVHEPLPFAHIVSPRDAFSLPRFASVFAGSAVAGLAVVQAAGRLSGHRPASIASYPLSWPLESAFSGGNLKLVVLGAFVVIGLIAGLVHPRRAWLLGFASVALFPVVVAIEIARDGTSHNLFPFEFVMFAFLALPAVAGAVAGAGLRGLAHRFGAQT